MDILKKIDTQLIYYIENTKIYHCVNNFFQTQQDLHFLVHQLNLIFVLSPDSGSCSWNTADGTEISLNDITVACFP